MIREKIKNIKKTFAFFYIAHKLFVLVLFPCGSDKILKFSANFFYNFIFYNKKFFIFLKKNEKKFIFLCFFF